MSAAHCPENSGLSRDTAGTGLRAAVLVLLLVVLASCDHREPHRVLETALGNSGPEPSPAKRGSHVEAHPRGRIWNVTCGLPQQDNPLLATLDRAFLSTTPWPSERKGHLDAKKLNRYHSESLVSTEMWMLSRNIGWWRLKVLRVHPDDVSKLNNIPLQLMADENALLERQRELHIRQIIESPLLSRPAIIRSWDPNDEALVNGQILAVLPNALQLRCSPQSDG